MILVELHPYQDRLEYFEDLWACWFEVLLHNELQSKCDCWKLESHRKCTSIESLWSDIKQRAKAIVLQELRKSIKQVFYFGSKAYLVLFLDHKISEALVELLQPHIFCFVEQKV